MDLSAKIEAILFFKGEPITYKELSSLLKVSEKEVGEAIESLENALQNRGLTLMHNESSVELRTSKESSSLIEEIRKEELKKDIGKAGAETLSIVLYRGPVTRAEIDYIRGVNSTFILRNLLIRGLVEKITNPKDKRAFLYKPTLELLSFLGISRVEELPDFDTVVNELTNFEEQQKEDEHGDGTK